AGVGGGGGGGGARSGGGSTPARSGTGGRTAPGSIRCAGEPAGSPGAATATSSGSGGLADSSAGWTFSVSQRGGAGWDTLARRWCPSATRDAGSAGRHGRGCSGLATQMRSSPGRAGRTGVAGVLPEPGSASTGRLSQLAQPAHGGVDTLVGGGQRHPDVAAAGGAVELAGGDQDAGAGQRRDRAPAVQAGPGRPQGQAPPRAIHRP